MKRNERIADFDRHSQQTKTALAIQSEAQKQRPNTDCMIGIVRSFGEGFTKAIDRLAAAQLSGCAGPTALDHSAKIVQYPGHWRHNAHYVEQ